VRHESNDTQNVIARLLTNIGSQKEVEQYLRNYVSVDAPKFAVVKVGGGIVDTQLDALASSLTFLQRVGLVPIVVHGASVQVERALAASHIATRIVDGIHAISPEALSVARRAVDETNTRLVDALEQLGARVRPFSSGVFDVHPSPTPDVGLVGCVTSVHEARLAQTAQAGILPVVAPVGETTQGQILMLDANAAARALALALRPHKVVYLNEIGGLSDGAGGIVPAVNLAEDFESMMSNAGINDQTRRKLTAIHSLLEQLPPTSSVSITSPEHLAKELFTHRGQGTFVRRGERVVRHTDWDLIDTRRLRDLLEECFGRVLDNDYFTTKKPYRVYLAESYRATAILTLEDDVPYLDKFGVTNEGQGQGIGASIWQRMRKENPKVFWRSRATNPINAWYAQSADGLYKTDQWWVFWCGMANFAEIQRSIERALAMPATFHAAVPPSAFVPAAAANP